MDIPEGRKKELLSFARPLNLNFKDISLLDLAFHHRSYSNESSLYHEKNNERLEFLGDSVLGMVTAAFLYQDMKDTQEGELSRILSIVVSEKSLAPIALRLGIDRMLVLGKGEEMSSGRKKPAILADCMEAIIGAYYLDSGYDAARDYVLSFIVPEIRKAQAHNEAVVDYKSILQEAYQKKRKQCPVYELVGKEGPDHDQTFFVKVHLGNSEYGPASGKSKKEAERAAACIAYKSFKW